MKKNYIQPNIKMAIAMETEEMIAASLFVDNSSENQITDENAILSRSADTSIWGEDEE